MSTTTIRLPKDLKSRVAAAAAHAGMTPHGFIVEAIAEKADRAAHAAEFARTADERYDRIVATGATIPWEKMRTYLEGRARGTAVPKPKARKLAR